MTKIKNILTIFLVIGLITIPQVSAFSLFGFDFGEAWNNFWGSDEESNLNETLNKTKVYVPEEIFTISVRNISISNKDAVRLVNSNPQISNILKEINYNCLYVNTDKNMNITIYLQNSQIKKIKKGKKCSDEIFFEESLIEDLKTGFDKSQIMTYLEKVEMPMKMYYNLIKAFS